MRDRDKQSGECGSLGLTAAAIGNKVRRVTLCGLAVNAVLTAVKGACGILGGSQALVADAVHSLSDCVTDVAVVVGVRYWSMPPDEGHPHGHRRIEALVTACIGAALASAAIGLGWRALSTIGATHGKPGPGWVAFGVAVLSIGVKEALYRWSADVGRRLHSSAVVANAWHHRSDALSSVPVAVAVVLQRIWPAMSYVDHVATVLVAWLLIHAAWKIGMPALGELIDQGAGEAARAQVAEITLGVEGVRSLHALRTRRSGPGYHLDLHVQVDGSLSVTEGHAIARSVRERLLARGPDVIDVLVQIEPATEGAERPPRVGRRPGRS